MTDRLSAEEALLTLKEMVARQEELLSMEAIYDDGKVAYSLDLMYGGEPTRGQDVLLWGEEFIRDVLRKHGEQHVWFEID
jgi:hypothetical protein